MHFCMWIFFLLFTKSSSKQISCGPDGKCSCNAYGEMDCSFTFVPLENVCDTIGNLSQNNITSLIIEHNGIDTINASDLKGCEFLSKLYLAGNNIDEIENSTFGGFENLVILDVNNNSLNIFNQSTGKVPLFPKSLTTLKVQGNVRDNRTQDDSYPDLSYLNQLKTLWIDGLQNQYFPEHYSKMCKLQNLILSGLNGYCNLSVVSNRTFENLLHLRHLNLSACDIREIHAGAYLKLPLLVDLDLSMNIQLGFRSMRNISYSLQFTNIQVLNISKLYTTFGIGTQLQKRDVCYLWNTSIRVISANSNRLQFFETNSVVLFPKTLNIAHFEDNKFTFAPYISQLACFFNVTELYASRQNSAHRPDKYFREPEDLVPKYETDSDDCPFMKDYFLRNISKSRGNCPFYEPDDIRHINPYAPQFPRNLKIFHIANSVLQYNVSGIFITPPNNSLEYIDASGNVLFAFHSAVGPAPRLKHLDLSKNYCSYINGRATSQLQSVENLQIQQNFLGLILADENEAPPIFDHLINVKTLNLSSNIISLIAPSTLSKMTKLETLDLSINNIEKWTIDVNDLDNLKNVNLRFNSLRSLPGALRKKLEENTKKHGGRFRIDLRNNSIVCTCDEKVFLEWMVKHRKSMTGFKEYIFHDASGSRISAAQFVAQVKDLDKMCRSYVLLIVLCSSSVSVFLAIVIGGFIYKNRWKLRYLVRMAKIRHFGYNKLMNDVQDNEFKFDAFISYSSENLQFIENHLCPNLENQGLKLCLHDRDFQPGKYVIDNILGAISNSKKTVVILSEAFLGSNWCMYEFNMARMNCIYSRGGSNNLLIVMFEEIANRNMSTEMLAWIKSNTYLEYTTDEHGEELFWKNLCDAIAEN